MKCKLNDLNQNTFKYIYRNTFFSSSFKISREYFLLENEKLSKRKKISKEMTLQPSSQVNLLDFWTATLNENNKNRVEFFGRAANPNIQIVPLYTNLKIEESSAGKSIG